MENLTYVGSILEGCVVEECENFVNKGRELLLRVGVVHADRDL